MKKKTKDNVTTIDTQYELDYLNYRKEELGRQIRQLLDQVKQVNARVQVVLDKIEFEKAMDEHVAKPTKKIPTPIVKTKAFKKMYIGKMYSGVFKPIPKKRSK